MNSPEGMVFGCMTPEEQNAISDAEMAGQVIEQFEGRIWRRKTTTDLWFHAAYRIAPTPVEAALAAKDAEIARLRDALQYIADGMGEDDPVQIKRYAPDIARAALEDTP